jgi:tetratricopeptide (TPR) repeat protein
VELAVPTRDFGSLGPSNSYPWGINVCRTRRAGGHLELFALAPTGEPGFSDLSKLGDFAVGDVYRTRLTDPPAPVGFAAEFQAAAKLLSDKDYAGAQAAFVKLAGIAPTAGARARCLARAADALGRQGEIDAALELAGRIEDQSLSGHSRMEILAEAGRFKELAESFGKTDIAAWPDNINYRGFYLRAGAFARANDRERAAADLEQCAALAGSDHLVRIEVLDQAAALRLALRDTDRALADYRQALAVFEAYPQTRAAARGRFPQVILGTSAILREQAEYDGALAVLAMMGDPDGEGLAGDWWCRVLESYGDIHLARGETVKALARYRQAAGTGAQPGFIQRVNGKIERIAANE